ncbi:TetR/AcrR family transcriptional regulator [[Pseudomonas] boreopolis]|uniref:TetR/AcrR family transcriptional regulator n=1 Tax=Xanthomonas boreopolis TaxID=86183 RepID=UPI003D43276A
MRYDADHKQRTRELVLKEASKAIRRDGPGKVGVAALMAKAGLTHGGFYAHFESKDDLVRAAIAYMFDEQYVRLLQRIENERPEEGLRDFIVRYLSLAHRNHPEKGCPVAALSNDVGRMSAVIRKQFDAGMARMLGVVAGALRHLSVPSPDVLAASILAEMVGAIAMSRALKDEELSEAVLSASRQSILERVGIG